MTKFEMTPEVELKWCQQDLRIAADNMRAAELRLADATEEWQHALDAERQARRNVTSRCQCGHLVADHSGNYNGSRACNYCACPAWNIS